MATNNWKEKYYKYSMDFSVFHNFPVIGKEYFKTVIKSLTQRCNSDDLLTHPSCPAFLFQECPFGNGMDCHKVTEEMWEDLWICDDDIENC